MSRKLLSVATLLTILLAAVFTPTQAQGPTPTEAITLTPVGNVEIEEGIAEIISYDPAGQKVYTSNTENFVNVIDVSDPTAPVLESSIDLSELGAGPNSLDFYRYDDGAGLLAVAIEAEVKTEPGLVALFDEAGELLNTVEAGVLPDMLTFTPDGSKIVVANEGEPSDYYYTDPEGSVTIIDLSAGAENAAAAQVDFSAYIGQEDTLRTKGVRIFGPGANAAQDLEPEYIAVSLDGAVAIVTLQENNAFAVIDLAEGTVLDIIPLGFKDYSKGAPSIEQYEFSDLPDLGVTARGQTIKLGGLSGLWFEGEDEATGNLKFATVPDRGPNGDPTDVDGDGNNERPFALPDYQAQVIRFELDPASGEISLTETILLSREDGVTPITGLPNIEGADEVPVDLDGNLLPYDELGADMEGIVVAPNGDFWMVDEYRPAIYHFSPEGVLINRYVPKGTAALAGAEPGAYGEETLPAEYITRRPNRGFEAMALDTDSGILYAFIQTPLMNPDRDASDASSVIRMLGIDPATGKAVAEYVYILEKPAYREGNVDKIGDAVYIGDGKFYVVDRDSAVGPTAKKPLFMIDINGATNLMEKSLEQMTPDDMLRNTIRPVNKVKVANLPSLGYVAGDKIEGLALLPDGRVAILNDNDFGLLPEPIPVDGTIGLNPDATPVVLGILSFGEGNMLDASDRDEAINLQNWPVLGMYQPDAIASFEVDGAAYYVTANEGDAREYILEDEEGEVIAGYSEEVRVADLDLDPDYFPDAEALQDETQLGRMGTTLVNGDIDGDGLVEQIFGYGARSFSIWDAFGNLVFDSGDQFAQYLAATYPDGFNGQADEEGNRTFDDRSDDKGSEPEGVVVGEIDGSIYAFVGLERDSGIMVYDVSDPTAPIFVTYANSGDAYGDISPEGLKFISAEDSPTGNPMLAVAYEVSGTVTLFEISQ